MLVDYLQQDKEQLSFASCWLSLTSSGRWQWLYGIFFPVAVNYIIRLKIFFKIFKMWTDLRYLRRTNDMKLQWRLLRTSKQSGRWNENGKWQMTWKWHMTCNQTARLNRLAYNTLAPLYQRFISQSLQSVLKLLTTVQRHALPLQSLTAMTHCFNSWANQISDIRCD